MKSIIYILALIISNIIWAQQTELLAHNWYLTKLNIENQEYIKPNSDISSMPPFEEISISYETNFDENALSTNGCNGFQIDLNELDENSFSTLGVSVTLNECMFPSYEQIDGKYYTFYGGFPNEEFPFGQFQYEIITNSDGSKTLIVTNPDQDKAYYSNLILSNQEELIQQEIQIVIQGEKLKIHGIEAAKISVYNLNGKLIINEKVNDNQIQTNNLPKGVYVVKISDKLGKTFTKKVHKK